MKKNHANYKCNNCGEKGHIFRNCLSPRTSIGIILFINYQNETHLLQIQRKDTIGFIDFIRGKFKVDDIQYMKKLLSIMTKTEQHLLVNKKFEELWNTVWFGNSKKNIAKYKKSFNYSKDKFCKIQNGIKIDENRKMTLKEFISSSESSYTETEWGFPKGRRERDETNKECACREVYEETGLKNGIDYTLHSIIKPIKIEFTGMNNHRYRHIFYIGQVKNIQKLNIKINKKNIFQLREIKDIKWFPLQMILEKTRPYNYDYMKKIIDKFRKIKEIKTFNTTIDDNAALEKH